MSGSYPEKSRRTACSRLAPRRHRKRIQAQSIKSKWVRLAEHARTTKSTLFFQTTCIKHHEFFRSHGQETARAVTHSRRSGQARAGRKKAENRRRSPHRNSPEAGCTAPRGRGRSHTAMISSSFPLTILSISPTRASVIFCTSSRPRCMSSWEISFSFSRALI